MIVAVKLIAFFALLALSLQYLPMASDWFAESLPRVAQWFSQNPPRVF